MKTIKLTPIDGDLPYAVVVQIAVGTSSFLLFTQEDGPEGPITLCSFGLHADSRGIRKLWKLFLDDPGTEKYPESWSLKNVVQHFVRWARKQDAAAPRARPTPVDGTVRVTAAGLEPSLGLVRVRGGVAPRLRPKKGTHGR